MQTYSILDPEQQEQRAELHARSRRVLRWRLGLRLHACTSEREFDREHRNGSGWRKRQSSGRRIREMQRSQDWPKGSATRGCFMMSSCARYAYLPACPFRSTLDVRAQRAARSTEVRHRRLWLLGAVKSRRCRVKVQGWVALVSLLRGHFGHFWTWRAMASARKSNTEASNAQHAARSTHSASR